MAAEPQRDERVRTAELIAALCLATDLGMAFPFEHGLHTTLIAMRLAGKLGIDRPSTCETYYACQLSTPAARQRPISRRRSSAAR